jgi:hypothetical protein
MSSPPVTATDTSVSYEQSLIVPTPSYQDKSGVKKVNIRRLGQRNHHKTVKRSSLSMQVTAIQKYFLNLLMTEVSVSENY